MLRLQMPKAPQIGFVRWGESFFDYLQKEKSKTNPTLLELIYCLGPDGRQELALSTFNFLRTQLWKELCEDKRKTKSQMRKAVSKSVKDLQKVTKAYSNIMVIAPEIGIGRSLAGGGALPLADVLEHEGVFLASQARMERVAARGVGPAGGCESNRPTKTQRRLLADQLSKTSTALTLAAESYRALGTFHANSPFSAPIHPPRSADLVPFLQVEAAKLKGVLGRVNAAFNTKRISTRANLAILIRLQGFVREFGLRWGFYMPPGSARELSEIDLADLLEAGRTALGMTGESTITYPETVGRALERFVGRKSNERTVLIWQRSGIEACDALRGLPPPFRATA